MAASQPFIPEPTTGESLSESLDSALAMNGTLSGLSESVEEKKRIVTSQSEELAALESQLRATEERLARVAQEKRTIRSDSITSHSKDSTSQQAYAGAQSAHLSNSLPSQYPSQQHNRGSATELRQDTSGPRPSFPRGDSLGTSRMPGAMPHTPASYIGQDYTTVDRTR